MKLKTTFLVALLAIFLLPVQSLACACCSERGDYSIWTGKPADYYLEVLEKIDFAEDAELYLGAAGFDAIKGLTALNTASGHEGREMYGLTDAFAARTWNLTFKAKNKQAGKLTLPLPTQMVNYHADIHDNRKSAGGGPLLYKEWRFKGRVAAGSGIFQPGIIKPTTYFLVLQGRGNGCDNPEDFTHWRLEISGPKANYSFFGKLDSGNPMTETDAKEQR